MSVHDRSTVDGWLEAMATRLDAFVAEHPASAFIGIRRGGVDVARLLHRRVAPRAPLGELDIAFYRDDFGTVGLHPTVGPSSIDFDLHDRPLILIDDVLGTGRTVRAALNELFDFGRPSRVLLAVLVERDGHELPIRADVAGQRLSVPRDHHIDFDARAHRVSVTRRKTDRETDRETDR